MLALSEKTKQLINKLFLIDDQPAVIDLLENECGNNLPFCNTVILKQWN